MTIEELNEIVKQMDLMKIQAALEQRGYRNASKNGKWEFTPIDIAKAGKIENSERYEDVFDDKVYVGDIHSEVEEYHDTKFVVITVNEVYRERNNLEVPYIMELYTNAPINEEYEREMAELGKCAICKRQFAMAELCEVSGKLVCDDCFEEDLQKLKTKGKSMLATKIKFKNTIDTDNEDMDKEDIDDDAENLS